MYRRLCLIFVWSSIAAALPPTVWTPGRCANFVREPTRGALASRLSAEHYVLLDHRKYFAPEFGRRLHDTLSPHRKRGLLFGKKNQFPPDVARAMEYFERYADGLADFLSAEAGLGRLRFYHGKFTVRNAGDGLGGGMGVFHLDADDVVVSLTVLGSGTWRAEDAADRGQTPTGVALAFDAHLRHAIPVADEDRVAAILRFSRQPPPAITTADQF